MKYQGLGGGAFSKPLQDLGLAMIESDNFIFLLARYNIYTVM